MGRLAGEEGDTRSSLRSWRRWHQTLFLCFFWPRRRRRVTTVPKRSAPYYSLIHRKTRATTLPEVWPRGLEFRARCACLLTHIFVVATCPLPAPFQRDVEGTSAASTSASGRLNGDVYGTGPRRRPDGLGAGAVALRAKGGGWCGGRRKRCARAPHVCLGLLGLKKNCNRLYRFPSPRLNFGDAFVSHQYWRHFRRRPPWKIPTLLSAASTLRQTCACAILRGVCVCGRGG